MEEISGEHRRGLIAQELPPRRIGAPSRRGRDLRGLEDPADRGCADPVAELEQLALGSAGIPSRLVASRSISAVISALTGGRPAHCGWVQWRETRRRCQRRTVPGATSRCIRSRGGRRRISAARNRPVGPVEPGPRMQDSDLMPQHEQLGVLGDCRPAGQGQPAAELDEEDEIDQAHGRG